MNLINAIPENLGWALVGATAMACVVMAVKLGKLIVTAIKEAQEESDDEIGIPSEEEELINEVRATMIEMVSDKYGEDDVYTIGFKELCYTDCSQDIVAELYDSLMA